MSGHQLCEACEAREAAQKAAAAAAYTNALNAYRQAAFQVPIVRDAIGPRIRELAAYLRPQDVNAVNIEVFRQVVNASIQDEYLSEDEETAMDSTIRILGIDHAAQLSVVSPIADRLRIARLNAGRFESVASPSIFLKPSETDLLEMPAQLLKEVVHRQMQGGYSGVSIRIAKGVRFNTGGYRGKSVVTGTSIEMADSGVLCVTSTRVVFKGLHQTVECLYGKLAGLNVFDDGIEFHVSNRQKASLFRVGDGHLVAAAVNAAVQKAMR
jgi:hypothetical protein